MFRYESVNSTRKFTIVAEIVSLLKKIYKRDAPFRAVFTVKTLAVLSLAYPREMKHIPRNLNMPPFCRCLFLWKWCNPFPRARARLKHAHSFDRCGDIMMIVAIVFHFRLSLAKRPGKPLVETRPKAWLPDFPLFIARRFPVFGTSMSPKNICVPGFSIVCL